MQSQDKSNVGRKDMAKPFRNGGAVGWFIAALLGGVLIGGGFQGDAQKIGVVDFANVVEKSDYFKTNKSQLDKMKEDREGLLEFLFTYKVAMAEQAQKLKDLILKENGTAADKAEIEKVKGDVMAADKTDKQLATKPNPTPDETALMTEYGRRKRATDELLGRWRDEFETQLQQKFNQVRSDSMDRGKAAMQEIGKAGGYTVIFRSDVAVYGANDLTDAALKAMNAKK
jgi:Skp family chaperone for outer membrane proteins